MVVFAHVLVNRWVSTSLLHFATWMSLSSSGLTFQEASIVVGSEAPDFELSDASGKKYRLSDFRGKSAVVLEFFRSGDW